MEEDIPGCCEPPYLSRSHSIRWLPLARRDGTRGRGQLDPFSGVRGQWQSVPQSLGGLSRPVLQIFTLSRVTPRAPPPPSIPTTFPTHSLFPLLENLTLGITTGCDSTTTTTPCVTDYRPFDTTRAHWVP